MEIITKFNGEKTSHDIPSSVLAVVHRAGIKVEAPNAYTISSKETVKCMEEMSEAAWVHISTGPLFRHFFDMLFKDEGIVLPSSVRVLVEDYDTGVVHGCGLIVLLCEAMFERRPQVFLKTPEDHLNPHQQAHLMSVILGIRKISGGVAPNLSSQLIGD